MRTLKLFLAAALTVAPLMTTPAVASDKADVLATVKQYDHNFNTGHIKAFLATCAPQAVIIDDFPPHVWQGTNACQNWSNDYAAFSKANGITGVIMTTGIPWHVAVTGDHAYVVVPAKLTYRQHGKLIVESEPVWTLALQKSAGIWLVTGWAWAQH